jgi:hypothetical protein
VTKGQILSAPIAVVHDERLEYFRLGAAPPAGLEALAEGGDTGAALAALSQLPGYVGGVSGATIQPGKSVTLEVTVRPGQRVSVLGQLQSTNDGFFALQSVTPPAEGEFRGFADAFDAGTEANTESCADVPSCGGSGAPAGEGQVSPHAGVLGVGDLSTLEHGWIGPPAEVSIGPDLSGTIEFPLGLSIGAPGEYVLQEPSMCSGHANARITYSRARNSVVVEMDYEGVPTDLTTTFPEDQSTPYAQFPLTVSNGVWQTWFVGYFGGKPLPIWYDATGRLIGTEYSLPNGEPPPGAFAVEVMAAHALCSPEWVPDESGRARVRWELEYDRLLDGRGTAGTIVLIAPYQYGDPNSVGRVDFGGVPVEDALTFDEVLNSIRTPAGIAIATTYGPTPKPEYLLSRANNVAGWLGTYPNVVDPTPPVPCETHINEPFPVLQGE